MKSGDFNVEIFFIRFDEKVDENKIVLFESCDYILRSLGQEGRAKDVLLCINSCFRCLTRGRVRCQVGRVVENDII